MKKVPLRTTRIASLKHIGIEARRPQARGRRIFSRTATGRRLQQSVERQLLGKPLSLLTITEGGELNIKEDISRLLTSRPFDRRLRTQVRMLRKRLAKEAVYILGSPLKMKLGPRALCKLTRMAKFYDEPTFSYHSTSSLYEAPTQTLVTDTKGKEVPYTYEAKEESPTTTPPPELTPTLLRSIMQRLTECKDAHQAPLFHKKSDWYSVFHVAIHHFGFKDNEYQRFLHLVAEAYGTSPIPYNIDNNTLKAISRYGFTLPYKKWENKYTKPTMHYKNLIDEILRILKDLEKNQGEENSPTQ